MLALALLLLRLELCRAGAVHPWPVKNGNVRRTSQSPSNAPPVLSEPAWTFEEPYPKDQRFVMYGSPLIDEQLNVYFAGTSGRIYSVDKHGVLRWQHAEEQLWVGDCHLHEKTLYCASRGGCAFALEAATGRELWRKRVGPKESIPTDGYSIVTDGEIMVVPFNGEGEYQYLTNNMLAGLDTSNGQEKWRLRLRDRPFNLMPSLVNGSTIMADTKGGAHRVNLRTGEYEWHIPPHPTAGFTTGGGSLSPDGSMFFLTANAFGTRAAISYILFELPGLAKVMVAALCCFAALFSAVKKKRRKLAIVGCFVAELLLAGYGLWLLPSTAGWDNYGMIRAVHANSGELAWEVTMPGEMSASPSVATLTPGGPLAVIYVNSICEGIDSRQVSCKNFVVAANAKNGAKIWSFQEPGQSTPLNFDVSSEKEGANDPTLMCIPDRTTNSAVGADGIVYVNVWRKTWALRDANGDGVVDPNDAAEATAYDMGYTDGLRVKAKQENAFQGSPAIAPGMLVVVACWKVAAFLA